MNLLHFKKATAVGTAAIFICSLTVQNFIPSILSWLHDHGHHTSVVRNLEFSYAILGHGHEEGRDLGHKTELSKTDFQVNSISDPRSDDRHEDHRVPFLDLADSYPLILSNFSITPMVDLGLLDWIFSPVSNQDVPRAFPDESPPDPLLKWISSIVILV